MLWQLPPRLEYDPERISAFLELLPGTTTEAAQIAARHDDRLPEDAAWTTTDADRPLRHALEVRHDSFVNDDALQLLTDHAVALVVADTAGRWPLVEKLTTDFAYVRLHGDAELYASGYSHAALERWTATIRSWADDGCDVYVYFDNDIKGYAPRDALALRQNLDPGRSR